MKNKAIVYFCAMGKKKTDKVIFENVTVLDAGAKGVSVAKAPEGQVIFLPNVVPGDVVDVQTLKKRKSYFEGRAIKFHSFSEHRRLHPDIFCGHHIYFSVFPILKQLELYLGL